MTVKTVLTNSTKKWLAITLTLVAIISFPLHGSCADRVIYGAQFSHVSNLTETPSGNSSLLSNRYFCYGLIAGTEALLFAFDKDINRATQEKSLHGKTADGFFRNVEHFGRGGPYIIAVPLLTGYGLIFKNRKSVVVAGELVAGIGISEGVTQVVKKVFGRRRPFESDSPYRFFKGGTSFYSGHSISAFTFASVFSYNYPRQDLGIIGIDHEVPVLPIVTYTMAGLVGFQRLYSNKHWASDVFASAVAGYGFGWLTYHFGKKIFLQPNIDKSGKPIGMILQFRLN